MGPPYFDLFRETISRSEGIKQDCQQTGKEKLVHVCHLTIKSASTMGAMSKLESLPWWGGHNGHLPSSLSCAQGTAATLHGSLPSPACGLSDPRVGLLFSLKRSECSNMQGLCRTVWWFSTSAQLAPNQPADTESWFLFWTCFGQDRAFFMRTRSETFPSSKTDPIWVMLLVK